MLTDEELARQAAGNPDAEDDPTPKFSEWSGVRDDLAALNDRIDRLAAILLGVNGNKAPNFKPHPRPKSAMERLRVKRETEKMFALRQRLESLPRR